MSNRLEGVLKRPPQGKTKLVTYLMAGDPDPGTTLRRLKGLADSGVDILELGVPFSDPIADGAVIQTAGQRALRGKMTVKKTIEVVSAFRQTHDTPVILMSYLNPLLRYGWDEFVTAAAQAGVDGLILPDLPWEEGRGLRRHSAERVGNALTFIPIIALTGQEQDLQAFAEVERGFAYVLSRNGTTGGEAAIPQEVQEFIRGLRPVLKVPCFVGFGIHKREQVQTLKDICDGVIVGSALVERFARLDREQLAGQLVEEELVHCEQNVYRWVTALKN